MARAETHPASATESGDPLKTASPARPARGTLWPLAALGGAFGIYGWAVFAATFHHDGVIGPRYNAPGSDFMVYYGAARAALEGKLAVLGDGFAFTAALNRDFAAWLSGPLSFHPFVYPPHYLLLLVPFGLLPFGAAYAGFEIVTFAALIAATRMRERHGILTASLLLCPAASITVVTGQNAFLTTALLVAGVYRSQERPILAGILLGALTVKPQLWLMVPVALLAARNWRCLAATVLAASFFIVASIAVFGLTPWLDWLAFLSNPPTEWRQWSILWGDDVTACVLLLGAGDTIAKIIQALAAILAALAVYRGFARPTPMPLRLALLLGATLLASPHFQGYDMVMLALAATLFFTDALAHGLRAGDAAIAIALWLAPIFSPPRVIPVAYLTPIVIAVFLWRVLARAPEPA